MFTNESTKKCYFCHGKGWHICNSCLGSGLIPSDSPEASLLLMDSPCVPCSECDGKGIVSCSCALGHKKISV